MKLSYKKNQDEKFIIAHGNSILQTIDGQKRIINLNAFHSIAIEPVNVNELDEKITYIVKGVYAGSYTKYKAEQEKAKVEINPVSINIPDYLLIEFFEELTEANDFVLLLFEILGKKSE